MDEYQFTTDGAGKPYMDVFVRSKQDTYPTPVTPDQLRSLLGRFTELSLVLLDNTSVNADVDTSNALYDCDLSSGSITLTLVSEGITGEAENDIIAFQITDIGNTLTITDENAVVTALTALNSFVVFKFNGTIWEFFYKADTSIDMKNYFTELGLLKVGVDIHTEEGDSEETNKPNIPIILKNLVYAFEDINVTVGNTEYYTDLLISGNVDLIFFCTSFIGHSQTILDINMNNDTTIIGGNFSTVASSGTIPNLKPTEILDRWIWFKDESV